MTALILPGQLDVPLRDRLRLAYDFTSLRERSRGVSPTAFYGAVGPGSFGMPSGNAGFQLPPGSFSPQRLTIVCRFRRNDFNALENHFLTADSYSISQRSFQFRLSGDTVQLIGFVSGSPLTVGGWFSEAYRDVPLTVGVTHDGTTTTILGLHGSNLATLYSGTGIGSPLDVTGAYPGVGVGWANASTAYDTTRSTTHRYLLAWDAALPLNDLREVMRDPGAAFQGRRILYFNVAGGGGATGTLAATESGSDTAALTGDVLIDGALAATESGSDTAALTGDVIVQGALAVTESGTDTAAATGLVLVQGALAATESGSDTAALAGLVLVQGSIASVEPGADTASIAGDVLVSGALAASETGSDTAAFTGDASLGIFGSIDAAESGSDSAQVTGLVLIQGGLAVTETGSDTAAITGPAAVSGSIAATETGSDTAAVTGLVLIYGSLATTETGSDTAAVSSFRPTVPGIEYTLPEGKAHYTLPDGRAHYTIAA